MLYLMALISLSSIVELDWPFGNKERNVATIYSTPADIKNGSAVYENVYPEELRNMRPDLSMHPLVLEKFIQHLDVAAQKTPIHHANGDLAFASTFGLDGTELTNGVTPEQYGDRLELDLWKAGLRSMRQMQLINGISYNHEGAITLAKAAGFGMEGAPLAWGRKYSLMSQPGARIMQVSSAGRDSSGVPRVAPHFERGVSYSSGASRMTRSSYQYRSADSSNNIQRGRSGI